MKQLLRALLLGLTLAGGTSQLATAHPLGNFTVNRYSRIEPGAGVIRVRHVVDVAEIPAVQERQAADIDFDGRVSTVEWGTYKLRKVEDLRRGLELTVDGALVPLETEQSEVSTPPGQANLPLIRVEAWFRASVPVGEHLATFRDRNEPTRVGWRELIVRPGPGGSILRSSAPTEDLSNELHAYPDALLQSPIDRREAELIFRAGTAEAFAPFKASQDVVARPADAFTALIAAPDHNLGGFLIALLSAAVLGGIHAASPGHGKTVMAAYIVGTRGTFLHALALALSVTVSHTAGVLLLGAITLFASHLIFPEQLYPWLTLISGMVVLTIGLGLLVRMASRGSIDQEHSQHHRHEHARGSEHGHQHVGRGHGHPHPHALPITWPSLFALGLGGGIVPSASALVVLLSALALGRLGLGLLLIVAFGAGMAVVLTATGFLIVHAGRLLACFFPAQGSSGRLSVTRAVPVLSALVMTLVGVVTTAQALGEFGLLRA